MDRHSCSRSENDNIKRILVELKDYLLNADVETALQVARKLNRQERIALPRADSGQTLLSVAVSFEQVPFVTFLLDKCQDDVNQRFVYGDCTALCLAVRRSNMELVRILVERGADVNASGPDGCTTVHLACERSPALVEYLIENDADVDVPDIYGVTCLMCSMGNCHWCHRICLLLVKQGASVNAVDCFGSSALHYAAGSRYAGPQAIHTLLLCGADPLIQNQSGEDVLQTAALSGTPDNIKFLLSQLEPANQRCSDLYSLIAAQLVNQSGNFASATELWKKSILLRTKVPEDMQLVGPNPVSCSTVEFHDVKSLAIADNENVLYMQALACRERILGRGHRETVHWLSVRALHHAQSTITYRQGINIYRYAAASCDGSTFVRPLIAIQPHLDFYRLFATKYSEDAASVSFEDVAIILRVMTEASKCTANIRRPEPCRKYTILQLSVNVVDQLCRLKSSDAESITLKQLLRALVRSKCETRYGENVLSVAVNHCPSLYIDGNILTVFPALPSSSAVEELVKAGADVNSVDSAGNTPLYLAVFRCSDSSSTQTEAWVCVIEVLLRHGAHVDVRNAAGMTAAEHLPSGFDRMQYIRLQCLAAGAIRKHGVTYRDLVPPTLAKFIDLH